MTVIIMYMMLGNIEIWRLKRSLYKIIIILKIKET